MRKNRYITDAKWNTKKRLNTMKERCEAIAAQWGDVDFFIMDRIERELIAKIDDIIKEVDGVDPKNH